MTLPQPPYDADERTMLCAFLDYHRAIVHRKCAGVGEVLARVALLPSPRYTIAGLVHHLTWVERHWFRIVLAGEDLTPPWVGPDPDADWRPPPGVPLDRLLTEYARECSRSRAITSDLALDDIARSWDRPVTLRWVLVHLIEETARHNGHADLVRELVDVAATG
jgi:hypothetical protein